MSSILKFWSFLSLIFCVVQSCTTNHEVDTIVYNANVYTLDSNFTIAEAIAIRNGVFIEVGSTERLMNKYRAKNTIDADGKYIYPGFYDSHANFMLFAEGLDVADLTGTTSYEELIGRLRDYAEKNRGKPWIVGKGWDQNEWEDSSFPTRDSLDKYFPDIPVFLSRIDIHAALVNTKALKVARIDSAEFVEGGLILTDSTGRMSGMLLDNAVEMVKKHVPEPDDKELIQILTRAQDSLFSVGLTSIVDAGLKTLELEKLKNFYAEGKLKIRNYAMIDDDFTNVRRYVRNGIYDNGNLTVRAVRIVADGTLGARGACLLAPYSDDSTNHGFLLRSPVEYDRMIKELAKSNFQVCAHAIGDSANRLMLDIYSKYLPENSKKRWRIEHAQVIHETDFKKFGQLGVIPSIQPSQAISDMNWSEKRLGHDRLRNAYAYKRLRDASGLVAIGSDVPVESYNPLWSFHAAVSRKDQYGYPSTGFEMKNALTRREALMGMTIWSAYACFEENQRGSISRGKIADFVILEEDIVRIPEERLRDVRTLRTVLGGETVYLRDLSPEGEASS